MYPLLSSARTFILALLSSTAMRRRCWSWLSRNSRVLLRALPCAPPQPRALGHCSRTAAAGGAGWFKAKAELFSHHKSLSTAQLFLCWTPQPVGFAALLLHPEIWGFPILTMKNKDFSTQPLFCCKCSPSEWQMHVGSKPLEFISLRDLKCQISANLK